MYQVGIYCKHVSFDKLHTSQKIARKDFENEVKGPPGRRRV